MKFCEEWEIEVNASNNQIDDKQSDSKGSKWGPALGVAGGPTMLSGLVWRKPGS